MAPEVRRWRPLVNIMKGAHLGIPSVKRPSGDPELQSLLGTKNAMLPVPSPKKYITSESPLNKRVALVTAAQKTFLATFFLHWRIQGWSKRPCRPPPQSLEGGPTYILPLPPKKTTASNRQTAINFPNFFKRVLKVVFSRGKIKNIQKK